MVGGWIAVALVASCGAAECGDDRSLSTPYAMALRTLRSESCLRVVFIPMYVVQPWYPDERARLQLRCLDP